MSSDAPTSSCSPPTLETDPYDLDILRVPYAFHEALREAAPVVSIDRYGIYAVGRYAEACQVISDWESFTNRGGVGIQDIRRPGAFRIPSLMLEVDPPDHEEVRSVVMKFFTPPLLRTWREAFARRAEQLVGVILDKRDVDGVEEIAEAFVLDVFPATVGVTLPREPTLAIGEMRFNQSGPTNALYHAAMVRAQPHLEWFENSVKRAGVLPGSIADLLFDAEDAGALRNGVASSIVRTFVGGGTDSTISAIGTTLAQLAAHPDQWQILRDRPSKVRAAFEEGIRFDCPFQVTYRTTTRQLDFAGYRLEPGTKVGVFLGAANRDPRIWSHPDRFDLMRPPKSIAFGFGIHACIGQMIARLEAEALLTALAGRVARLELTGDPFHRPINQMRTLDHLPLHVIPA